MNGPHASQVRPNMDDEYISPRLTYFVTEPHVFWFKFTEFFLPSTPVKFKGEHQVPLPHWKWRQDILPNRTSMSTRLHDQGPDSVDCIANRYGLEFPGI